MRTRWCRRFWMPPPRTDVRMAVSPPPGTPPVDATSRSATESALSAEVVAGLTNLELAARLVVEGAYAGRHRSRLHGLSTEFSEHRPYRPGDALKHVDWKLLARTDRLYTRRYRDTTSLPLVLVLDTSASMACLGASAPSRFRYAQVVAAALAWLAQTRGDGAGLLAGDGPNATWLPSRGGRRHLRALLGRIDALSPRAEGDPPWKGAAAIDTAATRLRRRGLLVVISDLLDHEDALLAALRRASVRGHDTAIFQLTSREELTFPWRGPSRFVDAETGATRLVDAGEIASRQIAAATEFHTRCATEAARLGIDLVQVSTDTPPARVLRRFLLARSR